jgi:hypothetical protein
MYASGFLVHVLVLENRPQSLRVPQQRMVVALELGLLNGLLDEAIGLCRILADDTTGGPGGVAPRDRRGFGYGIDPARENRVQAGRRSLRGRGLS